MGLIGLKELDKLSWVEEVQKVGDEFKVVAIVLVDEVFEFFKEVFPAFSASQFGYIHKDLYSLLDFETDYADVNLLFLLFTLSTLLLLLFLSIFLSFLLSLLLLSFLFSIFALCALLS
mgnify:FL=1